MARKRMIDPKIWESFYDKKLNCNDFTVLIAAISSADDEGRGKLSQIERNVGKMLTANLLKKSLKSLSDTIVLYGEGYYFLPNWVEYQTINRPKPSKIPAPFNDESVTNHGTLTDECDTSKVKLSKVEVEVEVNKKPAPQLQPIKLFATWGRAPDNGEKAKCENLLKQFGWDKVWNAFHIASERSSRGVADKRNVGYVNGILIKPDKDAGHYDKSIRN